MIDLKKLTPAPWASVAQRDRDSLEPTGKFTLARGMTYIAEFLNETDCDFAELARNAFDIMVRRGWLVQQIRPQGPWMVCGSQWAVLPAHRDVISREAWDDPFTAIVESEKWYQANVEQPQGRK